MIASTTTLITNVLVSAAEHGGGEEIIRTQHNPYFVGICTFIFLVVCLMITLSFNRDR